MRALVYLAPWSRAVSPVVKHYCSYLALVVRASSKSTLKSLSYVWTFEAIQHRHGPPFNMSMYWSAYGLDPQITRCSFSSETLLLVSCSRSQASPKSTVKSLAYVWTFEAIQHRHERPSNAFVSCRFSAFLCWFRVCNPDWLMALII